MFQALPTALIRYCIALGFLIIWFTLPNIRPVALAQGRLSTNINTSSIDEVFGRGRQASAEKPFPLRTHQPVYQNPFDLSAGGASLTKASQEGSFFVNPSLPAFGLGLSRWTFARTQVHLGAATAETIYKAYSQQGSASPISTNLVTQALKTRNHAGHDTAFGYINKYISVVGFSNARADLSLRKFGDAGAPQIRIRGYGIGGGGVGLSYALGDFLAIGATSKYLEVAQAADNLSLTDAADPANLSSKINSLLKRGKGISSDAAATLQIRSKHLDFRLAGVVSDIANTNLGSELDPFLQTVSLGAGLSLHTRDHSLHCAADVRDILAAYNEHWTYRSYAGCKLLYYKRIGIGAGFSQGYPSAGLVLDFVFARIEAGTYTREAGRQIGVEGRKVYFFAIGSDI